LTRHGFAPHHQRRSNNAEAAEEHPTANGPADYALVVDGRMLAVVEAKKVTLGPEPIGIYLDVVDPLDQAQRRALHRPPTKKTREFFEALQQLAPEA
jgi:hypothetical protein